MKKTFLRKLIKFSHYSTCLTLPKIATDALSWDAGSALEIKLDAKKRRLIITDHNNSNNKLKMPETVTLELKQDQKSQPFVTEKESKKLSPKKETRDDDLLPLEEL